MSAIGVDDVGQEPVRTIGEAGGRVARTRHSARRRHTGGFDAVALWGTLLLAIAAFWLAGPLRDIGNAGLVEAPYVSRLVLHAWVGDLASVERFLVLSRQLEPSSLGYWLTAVASGVVGAEQGVAIFQSVLTLIVAGLAVAYVARRAGGRATGWGLAAGAILAPAGTVVGAVGVGESLGLALFLALLVLWSERGGIRDIMGAVVAALLLALTFLASAPVLAVGLPVLVLLTVLDGLRGAAMQGARAAMPRALLALLFLVVAAAPALVLLALYVRENALDWATVLTLLSDPSAGEALAARSAVGKAQELGVLTLAIGVYAAVVCGLARLIDGAWRREDGLAVAAIGLWLVFLLTPWGGLDTGVGRAVGVLAWVLSALWCGTVGVSLIVRAPALAALVVLAGMMAGGAIAHREDTAQIRAEAETVAALLGRDERVMSLVLEGSDLARPAMLHAAGLAGSLELGLRSVSAGAEERLVSVNPPLRFAEGMSPVEIAGNDPAARPLFVFPAGWDLPEPGRQVQMLAVLGRPSQDDAGWARALGVRIEPYYEPVYRSANGGPIALYSLRDLDAGVGQ
ncbi:MAG: hypothetical protein LPL00_05750 [Alphaproteobacteria bacterium]|nr:hypothetical protein [Alphaproteobacteria bacterium]MDX5369041.1 hypothetical protein [Alphaproteobacteria bacterium]MDX5463746.1 hypothetical protein [Alphaproteobacteria bacterium]